MSVIHVDMLSERKAKKVFLCVHDTFIRFAMTIACGITDRVNDNIRSFVHALDIQTWFPRVRSRSAFSSKFHAEFFREREIYIYVYIYRTTEQSSTVSLRLISVQLIKWISVRAQIAMTLVLLDGWPPESTDCLIHRRYTAREVPTDRFTIRVIREDIAIFFYRRDKNVNNNNYGFYKR